MCGTHTRGCCRYRVDTDTASSHIPTPSIQIKKAPIYSMPYNRQKMENALLALIGALEFEDGRFWKGYDFDLLNSLHEQGLISQPWGKAKSARLTPEGLEKAKALAEEMLGGESDL